MNVTQRAPLDMETLEQLSFERSKFWGTFLNKISNVDEEVELELNNVDEFYLQIDEEKDQNDDEMASIEECLTDEEILKDITNRHHTTISGKGNLSRQMKLLPYKRQIIGRLEEANDNEMAIQDILDQTRPILLEHERMWKEAGIDRVLNTFDPQKIEEKVGGWLRRNRSNASYSNDSCIINNAPPYTPWPGGCNQNSTRADDSETDSFHSVDTARYILSSRKKRGTKQFSSSCTTMTIKTYRMVQSKRDALRQKYACLDPEDAEFHKRRYHHSQAVHNRLQADKLHRHLNLASGSYRIQRRRKNLSKRLSSSSAATNSSNCSSSDEEYRDCRHSSRLQQRHRRLHKDQHHCCSLRPNKNVQQSILSSSSNLSTHSVEHNLKSLHRHATINNDIRPYIRESDCSCRDSNKLCVHTRHLANSSTEEWIVENCDTPIKPLPVVSENQRSNKSKYMEQKSALEGRTIFNKGQSRKEISASILPKFTKKDRNQNGKHNDKKQPENKSKNVGKSEKSEIRDSIKKGKNKGNLRETLLCQSGQNLQTLNSNSDINSHKISISDDDYELDLAIRNSRQTYEHEIRQKLQITGQEKPLKQSRNVPEVIVLDEEEAVISKKIFKPKQQKTTHEFKVPPKQCVKPQPKCVKLRKAAKNSVTKTFTNDLSEETFLTNANNVCNSTAFANNTATSRQFSGAVNSTITSKTNAGGKKVKWSPAVSSTNNAANSTPATSNRSDASPPSDDNDCTIVSSTTGDMLKRQTLKGILLYTPADRTLAPAHSFDNGFFNITKEHLSNVIGERAAQKFLKYYIGRRRFDSNSTIYYRPPRESMRILHEDTDSEDDALECLGQYGELYESTDKGN